jgi:hypothetical protein
MRPRSMYGIGCEHVFEIIGTGYWSVGGGRAGLSSMPLSLFTDLTQIHSGHLLTASICSRMSESRDTSKE